MRVKIKQFVKEWMEGHEPDTFVRNEHGACLYSAGHSTLNLQVFFEEIVEDALLEFAEKKDGNKYVRTTNGEICDCIIHSYDLLGKCMICGFKNLIP